MTAKAIFVEITFTRGLPAFQEYFIMSSRSFVKVCKTGVHGETAIPDLPLAEIGCQTCAPADDRINTTRRPNV